jgi:hypothetical protein
VKTLFSGQSLQEMSFNLPAGSRDVQVAAMDAIERIRELTMLQRQGVRIPHGEQGLLKSFWVSK